MSKSSLDILQDFSLFPRDRVQNYPLVFRFRWTPLQSVPFIGPRPNANRTLRPFIRNGATLLSSSIARALLLCLQTNRSREIISFNLPPTPSIPCRRLWDHWIPCSVSRHCLPVDDRLSLNDFIASISRCLRFRGNFAPYSIWISSSSTLHVASLLRRILFVASQLINVFIDVSGLVLYSTSCDCWAVDLVNGKNWGIVVQIWRYFFKLSGCHLFLCN